MNMVYDLVLNFSDIGNLREAYEWNKSDKVILVERIPIFRVNQKTIIDMFKSCVKINKNYLKKIYRKTYTELGLIDYCCLFTDLSRVIALKFNENGLAIEESVLLIDEESVIIDENYDLVVNKIAYKTISSFSNNFFMTRKEKEIQRCLIFELEKLYYLKIYDEIEYLYYEMFSDVKKVDEMYTALLKSIQNEFSKKLYDLYNIVKMIPVTTKI